MVYRWILPVYGFFITGLIFVAGCAPGFVDSSVSPSPEPGASSAARQVTGPVSSSAQSRSLEAFRRGMDIPSASPGSPSSKSSPLKDIYFDFDRYTLQPAARQTLKANAQWLNSYPAGRIEIEGHADNRGTNEYNLALGARRAQAVKDYLATLGISHDRLSTISYGEELPVCNAKGEDCWRRNRRAHFVIISSGPAS